MFRKPSAVTIIAGALLALVQQRAHAIPAFARQTGQACAACHVGSFGPQLTQFGRAFKVEGYTATGGTGVGSNVPLSIMALGSFSSTTKGVPPDQVTHQYGANGNFAMDQLSAFVAGRIGDHTGGFIQLTFSDIPNGQNVDATNVDNVDLRPYTTSLDLGDHELRIGTTLTNNPTVQDPYNSTYAWGYPYAGSGLAPTPTAATFLGATALAGNAIGYTVYAWYDRSLYLEAGAYNTFSPWLLARFGNDYGIGATRAPAPYLRAAYEWDWNGQEAHIGALFMHADVNPPNGVPFQTDGSLGSDHYTDYAIDGSYAFIGDGTHTVSVQGILTHEEQSLNGTTAGFNQANGTAYGASSSLNQLNVNLAYWYRNTYGLTVGWSRIWGPANPVLYQPGELTGSASGKPDSNAFTIEADWVPFGKDDSWLAPWANLKLGLQYTLYTEFNGGTSNYDGSGRNAGDNNTLFGFAWLAF